MLKETPSSKTVATKSVRKYIPLIVVLVIFIGLFSIRERTVKSPDDVCRQVYGNDLRGVQLVPQNNALFGIEVAKTEAARQKGLSSRTCIGVHQAMLFEFEQSEKHGFWMKDMEFAIDMIWLDDTKAIVYIQKNATPSSYPQIFEPTKPAKYVLEMKSGSADQLGLYPTQVLRW